MSAAVWCGRELVLKRISTNKLFQNISKNLFNLQDINKYGSSICSTNIRELPERISENQTNLQDVNKSGLSIHSSRRDGNTEIDSKTVKVVGLHCI